MQSHTGAGTARATGPDETHDPSRRSWVPTDGCGFPIQNLPYCRFSTGGAARLGAGIGSQVVDVIAARAAGLLDSEAGDALAAAGETLHGLMGLPPGVLRHLRRQLAALLSRGSGAAAAAHAFLLPQSAVTLLLPAQPPAFTDFFTSIHHARNAGELRRPGNPLPPNFHHMPIAYNGRATTVRASGSDCMRPCGQYLDDATGQPVFGPTRKLDFECELAVWIGEASQAGQPVPLAEAGSHVFGIGLLNDWSARDIQLWESQPLGPLLSKGFLTTVSPWVVTADALAPFRRPAASRAADAPPLPPYLVDADDAAHGGLSIRLSVAIQSSAMRERGLPPCVVARPDFADQYWTLGQMLVHLTSNGGPLTTGELLGTGTVSGPTPRELGCLLELTRLGREPLALPGGETRLWLEDGDEVVLTGTCHAPGFVPIGLGESRGRVLPAAIRNQGENP